MPQYYNYKILLLQLRDLTSTYLKGKLCQAMTKPIKMICCMCWCVCECLLRVTVHHHFVCVLVRAFLRVL